MSASSPEDAVRRYLEWLEDPDSLIDDEAVGSAEIVTQPGYFCLTGDGICVGRDSASAVTPVYVAPFEFHGGTIDRVVVDVSGERYIDHEAEVRTWFALD